MTQDKLLAQLTAEDAAARAEAATALGNLREAQALDALAHALRHDDNDGVRERCAVAIAQIGGGRAVDLLLDALDGQRVWVTNRIAYLLGASRDPRAADALLELLDAPEPSTQGVAAWALGAIGAVHAVPSLRRLLHDPNPDVRGSSAWALGELGGLDVLDDLVACTRDDAPDVRAKAAWALGALSERTGNTDALPALLALLDDNAVVRDNSAHVFVCQYAAEALWQLGTPEARAAVEAWRPRAQALLAPYRTREMVRALAHPDAQTRQEAANALMALGEEAVPHLREGLRAKPARVRQQCARLLGELHAAEAADDLIAALEDADSGVWSQAVGALAKLPTAANRPLYAALTHANTRVKLGAGIALWRRERNETGFKWLLVAMNHEDMLVQSSAITSLWSQPDGRALLELQRALTFEDTMLNRYIAQALQAIGTDDALALLQAWLAHVHPNTH